MAQLQLLDLSTAGVITNTPRLRSAEERDRINLEKCLEMKTSRFSSPASSACSVFLIGYNQDDDDEFTDDSADGDDNDQNIPELENCVTSIIHCPMYDKN